MLNRLHPSTLKRCAIVAVGLLATSNFPVSIQAFNFGRHKNAQPSSQTQASPAESPDTAGQTPPPQQTVRTIPAPTITKTAKEIHRADISGQFTYILPMSWRTHQIPYQPHDVLSLRDGDNTVATVTFSEESGEKDLEQLKSVLMQAGKNESNKYQLVSAESGNLTNGEACLKMTSITNIDEVDTRRLQCAIVLKKKHYLIATLTVAKTAGDKYDKSLDEVVNTIEKDKSAPKK